MLVIPVNTGKKANLYGVFGVRFHEFCHHKFDFSHNVSKFERFCDEEKSNFLIKNIVYDPQGKSPKGPQ